MAGAKDVQLRVIPARVANPFIRAHHYSGKVVANSQLHFGAFMGWRLHGVMSYGPSMDKRKMLGLVRGTTWDGFLELNRMAFDSALRGPIVARPPSRSRHPVREDRRGRRGHVQGRARHEGVQARDAGRQWRHAVIAHEQCARSPSGRRRRDSDLHSSMTLGGPS